MPGLSSTWATTAEMFPSPSLAHNRVRAQTGPSPLHAAELVQKRGVAVALPFTMIKVWTAEDRRAAMLDRLLTVRKGMSATSRGAGPGGPYGGRQARRSFRTLLF